MDTTQPIPAAETTSGSTLGLAKGPKITVFFIADGSAPILKRKKFKFGADTKFGALSTFLRTNGPAFANIPLCLLVNKTFQPSFDQPLAELFDAFGQNDRLVVYYSQTEKWG